MIAESVRHALSDPGHSHLPLCPDYEGDSPKGEPLELRFPVKTGIVMGKPPALAVGCMTNVKFGVTPMLVYTQTILYLAKCKFLLGFTLLDMGFTFLFSLHM